MQGKTNCRQVIQLDYGFDNGGLPSNIHTKPIFLKDYSIVSEHRTAGSFLHRREVANSDL